MKHCLQKLLPISFGFILFLASGFFSTAHAATINTMAYGPTGSTVGTYVQASDTDFTTFTPITAITTGSTITLTFPIGTTLTSANIAVTDFAISQATQGLCVNPGVATTPTNVSVNEGARTITLTVASASISDTVSILNCGLGQVTIATSALFNANEIRHPTTTTTTGTFQIDTSVGDTGSISNVSFVHGTEDHLIVTGTGSMTAGDTNELTVTAYDQYGNTATGYSGTKGLTFSGLSNSPNGTVPTIEGTNQGSSTNVDFSNGVSNSNAATLVAYAAESASLDVTDGSINSTSNTSYDLDLTVSFDTADHLSVTGTGSMTAGATNELTITANDTYGNTDTSYTGSKNLTFSGLSNAPSGTVPTIEGTNQGSTTAINFTSGQSDSNAATLITYAAETTSLDVTDGSLNSTGDTSYDLDLTVSATTENYLVITGTSSITAGSNNELTITAYDEYGNVATGYAGTKGLTFSGLNNAPDSTVPTIEGTNQGSTTNITFTSGSSNANAATLIAYAAESASLDVTDGSINSTGDTSYDLDLTISAASASVLSKNSGDSQTTAVNTTLSSNLETKLVDDYENPISGATVNFSITSSPSGSSGQSLSASSDITDANGLATTSATLGNTAGTYQVTASSTGVSSVIFSETATDLTAPTISSISVTPSSTSVTITWTTNEEASTQLNYGLTNSYGSSTTESDTTNRVTSHSDSISSLKACTTYHVQVESTDYSTNQATSSDQTFTTTGCTGNSAVVIQEAASITTASGGSTEMLSSGYGVHLDIPSSFNVSDAEFQLKWLNKSSVVTEAPLSGGLSGVNNYVFDLSAYTSPTSQLTSFDQPISVRIQFSSDDISSFNSSSLRIYRWNGSAWSELSTCSTDTDANTITCTTTGFSTFILAGTETSSSESSSESSSSSSGSVLGSTSSASAPQCTDNAPDSAPWLFTAETISTKKVKLYFTSASGPLTHYVLEYGTSPSNYEYGIPHFGYDKTTEVEISDLQPNTSYYFRVRANNNCATGSWSNEISASTFFTARPILDVSEMLTSNIVVEEKKESEKNQNPSKKSDKKDKIDNYILKLQIKDDQGKPLKHTKVELHSIPQTATTDKNGQVIFENVEPGNHTLYIKNFLYESEQPLFISGDTETITLEIQVKPTNPYLLTGAAIIAFLLGATSIVIGLFIFEKYHHKWIQAIQKSLDKRNQPVRRLSLK